MILEQDKKTVLSSLDTSDLRLLLSFFYLKGKGLEVGALHHPLELSTRASVKYLDRLPVSELRRHYPELSGENLVDVDIVDDGERLLTVANSSMDFIIANHMLEHCKNPIQTIQTFLAKLKPGGIIYMAVPDKRFCFDRLRNLTPFDHLLGDYQNKNDHYPHYVEWARFVDQAKTEQEIQSRAQFLYQMQYSIHFHVWDYYTFVDFLIRTNQLLNFEFDIANISFNDHLNEIITILKKK